jgi:hypothetical protein
VRLKKRSGRCSARLPPLVPYVRAPKPRRMQDASSKGSGWYFLVCTNTIRLGPHFVYHPYPVTLTTNTFNLASAATRESQVRLSLSREHPGIRCRFWITSSTRLLYHKREGDNEEHVRGQLPISSIVEDDTLVSDPTLMERQYGFNFVTRSIGRPVRYTIAL